MAGLPYVGAGVFASAAAMDKEFTKKLLAADGLPVGRPRGAAPRTRDALTAAQREPARPAGVREARPGRLVARHHQGHRLGRARRRDRRGRVHDPKVLVEAAVAGREIECGVLELPDGTAAREPARRDPDRRRRRPSTTSTPSTSTTSASSTSPPSSTTTSSSACRRRPSPAFLALDCQGLARVDFFVGADGVPVINEVNTMPGFTPISMYPRMWAATGVDYPTLLTTLIDTALAPGGPGSGSRSAPILFSYRHFSGVISM